MLSNKNVFFTYAGKTKRSQNIIKSMSKNANVYKINKKKQSSWVIISFIDNMYNDDVFSLNGHDGGFVN